MHIEATVFVKKLGDHRGNPRIFFETESIQRYGFMPGARYDMALRDSKTLELALNPKGKRAVCKKGKGERVLSVIDINSASVMDTFRGETMVSVTLMMGSITIRKLEQA